MMSRAKEYLRIYIVSFEAVVIIGVTVSYFFWPDIYIRLDQSLLSGGPGVDVALLFAPTAAFMATYKAAEDLLNPPDKTVLTQWPEYWRLRARVWAALVYAAIGVAAWFAGFGGSALTPTSPLPAMLVTIGGGISIITLLTVLIARLQLKEVLAGA